MPRHRNPRPNLSKSPSTNNPDTTQEADQRPYVAVLLRLGELGWRVTELRADRTPPVIWHVTITRYDEDMTMSIVDANPEAALKELIRYASADEGAVVPAPVASPDESAGAPGLARTRDELEAALHALGWQITEGPTQIDTGWKATIQRGTSSTWLAGSTEVGVLEELLRYAEAHARRKP